MIRTIVESPYRGDVARNKAYLDRCLLDSLKRNESPIASHKIWPSILDDDNPEQRERGIEAGLAWVQVADLMAVYTDHGISDGMENAMSRARKLGIKIEYREIGV